MEDTNKLFEKYLYIVQERFYLYKGSTEVADLIMANRTGKPTNFTDVELPVVNWTSSTTHQECLVGLFDQCLKFDTYSTEKEFVFSTSSYIKCKVREHFTHNHSMEASAVPSRAVAVNAYLRKAEKLCLRANHALSSHNGHYEVASVWEHPLEEILTEEDRKTLRHLKERLCINLKINEVDRGEKFGRLIERVGTISREENGFKLKASVGNTIFTTLDNVPSEREEVEMNDISPEVREYVLSKSFELIGTMPVQVQPIFKRILNGETATDIAKEMGTSRQYVSKLYGQGIRHIKKVLS